MSTYPPNYIDANSRRRHGSFSNSDSSKSGSGPTPFHQRSRSSSGRFRTVKTPQSSSNTSEDFFFWPTHVLPASRKNTEPSVMSQQRYEQHLQHLQHLHQLAQRAGNFLPEDKRDTRQSSEPIYCEPLPPPCMARSAEVRELERSSVKFFPDPSNPTQISDHIYEYLVSRKPDGCPPPKPPLNRGRLPRRPGKRGSLSSSPSDEGSLSHTSTESSTKSNSNSKRSARKNLDQEFSSSGRNLFYFICHSEF